MKINPMLNLSISKLKVKVIKKDTNYIGREDLTDVSPSYHIS